MLRAHVLLAFALALWCGFAPTRAQAQRNGPVITQQEGENAATAIQRTLVEEHARLRGLIERFGAAHADTRTARAVLVSLVASLRAELAARGRIDRPRLREWLRIRLADADAQLAAARIGYGDTHIDVRVAQAERAALGEALAAIERTGRFFSDVP